MNIFFNQSKLATFAQNIQLHLPMPFFFSLLITLTLQRSNRINYSNFHFKIIFSNLVAK